MTNIIDFILYKVGDGVHYIEEDDDDCDRPFHARLNIVRGRDDYLCNGCMVEVDLAFHPSFDGALWVERNKDIEQS